MFLTGSTRITVPGTPQEAIFEGGKNGLLFLMDTANLTETGHLSSTLDEQVVSLQIPTEYSAIPEHKLLYHGQCNDAELSI